MKKGKSILKSLSFFLVCIVVGIALGTGIRWLGDGMQSKKEALLVVGLALIGIVVGLYINFILHEAGHLIFGLLTGYRFCSFRIGSVMLKKENGRLRLCRFSLAGTGGQCLMSPPEWKTEGFPFVWYNMGGCLMNFILTALFVLLAVLFRESLLGRTLCLSIALAGLYCGLVNAIPIETETVNNDGSNLREIARNAKARYAFWLQLRLNQEISEGVRLKDMPEAWFCMPEEEELQNAIIVSQAILCCNRKMDEGKLEEAYEMMQTLLEKKTAMMAIYRALLHIDCAFCEMISENQSGRVEKWLDDTTKAVMNAMKRFPTTLRTQYAYDLLVNGDEEKAKRTKEAFDQMSKTYPNPCELVSERAYMELAEERWRLRKEET